VLTAGCLLMAIISPQGAIIVLILIVQIILVVWRKPYAGERAWLRPFLNLLISALIQAVFILTPTLSSNATFAAYSPLAI
jgi:NADH:ubiquinone oxidoreductase subunit 6 (subunit J)